jgi:hypothetical protein
MTKEMTEKKKVNPLVYFIGIPVGIYILVLSYNAWEKDRIYRECVRNINYLGITNISKGSNNQGFVYSDNVPNCLQVLGNK